MLILKQTWPHHNIEWILKRETINLLKPKFDIQFPLKVLFFIFAELFFDKSYSEFNISPTHKV